MTAKSGFYVYISIIIMVIPTVEWVHACGPITHIEIAHRAREIVDTSHEDYRKLLYLHGDAYEAGSVYPDTYYYPTCYSGHYHSISEDTHWVPFINATVNYIRRTYGDPPWNVSGQKLVAFLFGVTSHQIADVLWHSFDIKQGFLQTLAKMDFHDDFDIAHSFGDIADDAVNMYSLDTEYIPYTSWYIPVNDLYLIYRDMYGEDKISTAVIQDCTAMMLMMRLGEKIAFPQLYHHYAKRSPFIVDELEHYFQGGITDMSMWSVRKYKQVIEMMEQSTRSCNLTRNIIFVHCNNESSLPSDGEPRPTRSAAPDLSTGALKFTLSDVNVTDAYNGISVTVNQNGMEYLENMNKGQPAESRSRKHNSMYQEYVDRDKREPQRQPHQTYTTKYMYSKLGWCTLSRDLNGDGDEDLILSAPGYSSDSLAQIGRVYIIYGPDFPVSAQSDPLYIEDVADFILEGVHEGSQFGYAVTFVDLNGDNITDIAISAPRDGSELLQYTGAVYVFYGSTGGYLHHPDITILCKVQYCNLGETLSYGDIDNSGSTDLIIGAPTASHNGTQAGLVGVVLAKKQTASVMFIEDAEYILYGRQNYSWFGAAVEHYTVGISNMLIIGAPNYRICNSTCTSYNNSDTQTVGAVYIYRDLYIKYNTVNTTLYGSVEFERFGAALAVGINQELDFYTLSIASPSKLSKLEVYRFDTMTMYQAGAVYLYNISTINVTLYASLHGDRPIAKYGQHVLFTDINYDGNDDLLISVPLRNPDLTQHVVTENHGKVYVYLHNTLTTGDITSRCGVWAVRPCPGHMNALEFATAERNGQFGSSFTVVKQNRTQTYIAVSSVMSNLAGRLTGMIQLYLLH